MSHPYGWQALYRAVVLETDSRKLPHSIVLAEQTIKQRLLDGPSLQIDTAESQAMHKALDTLAVLKAEHTARESDQPDRAQGFWSILKDV
jgi:hypothetical protein